MLYKSLILQQVMSLASTIIVSSMQLINRPTMIYQENTMIARIKVDKNLKKMVEKELLKKQSPTILHSKTLTKTFSTSKILHFEGKAL